MLVSRRFLQMLVHSDLVIYLGSVSRGVGVDEDEEWKASRGFSTVINRSVAVCTDMLSFL